MAYVLTASEQTVFHKTLVAALAEPTLHLRAAQRQVLPTGGNGICLLPNLLSPNIRSATTTYLSLQAPQATIRSISALHFSLRPALETRRLPPSRRKPLP
jgi:hypothetical protein